MSADLENFKIQLQQVEAALIGEPDNKDLLELRDNVKEVIALQEQVVSEELGEEPAASSDPGSSKEKDIAWKVGDRCLAPSKNGQRFIAVIDGISQNNVAVTFANNGTKAMVRLNELKAAPQEDRKNYLFQNKGKSGPSKEWQAEKERRKVRAQKKEIRKKQLDEAGEKTKNNWQSFNNKALNKGFKGIKKVEQSRSAPDGPRTSGARQTTISSRQVSSFGNTSRGNMDSLF